MITKAEWLKIVRASEGFAKHTTRTTIVVPARYTEPVLDALRAMGKTASLADSFGTIVLTEQARACRWGGCNGTLPRAGGCCSHCGQRQ